MCRNTTYYRYGKAMRRRNPSPLFVSLMLLGAALIVIISLCGCAELSYKAGELYGWNCRPEALQNGRCVPAR
jgi:hypothetical protein